MDAKRAQNLSEMRIVREHGPTVAVAAKRFRRKEARCGCKADRADLAAFVSCAEALRGVAQEL
jgi:hypothetical protein